MYPQLEDGFGSIRTILSKTKRNAIELSFNTIRFVSTSWSFLIIRMSKSYKKWPSYAHSNLGQKWRPGLLVFSTEIWLFWPYFLRYELQNCFAIIYIKIKGQTQLEVNWTQVDYFILYKPAWATTSLPRRTTKMAISQNSILAKCQSPISLLLLFSIILSETFEPKIKKSFLSIIHLLGDVSPFLSLHRSVLALAKPVYPCSARAQLDCWGWRYTDLCRLRNYFRCLIIHIYYYFSYIDYKFWYDLSVVTVLL